MKSKLLPIILIVLVLLNVVLIFMLIKKPHQKRNNESRFLTEQLEFTNNQNEKFILIDNAHREAMKSLDSNIIKQKELLFNSFSDNSINVDSLSKIIGELEGRKEAEVFRFFKSVRDLCTKSQQEKFNKIINKAIRGGGKGEPRDGKNHSPKDGRMPPPPPR